MHSGVLLRQCACVQLGSAGSCGFAVLPHFSQLTFYVRANYHLTVEGVGKDLLRAVASGHTGSPIAINPANLKVMQARAKHVVLHSACSSTVVDPVAHIGSMKMDEGALLFESLMGYLVRGLSPAGGQQQHLLETMMCASPTCAPLQRAHVFAFSAGFASMRLCIGHAQVRSGRLPVQQARAVYFAASCLPCMRQRGGVAADCATLLQSAHALWHHHPVASQRGPAPSNSRGQSRSSAALSAAHRGGTARVLRLWHTCLSTGPCQAHAEAAPPGNAFAPGMRTARRDVLVQRHAQRAPGRHICEAAGRVRHPLADLHVHTT